MTMIAEPRCFKCGETKCICKDTLSVKQLHKAVKELGKIPKSDGVFVNDKTKNEVEKFQEYERGYKDGYKLKLLFLVVLGIAVTIALILVSSINWETVRYLPCGLDGDEKIKINTPVQYL